VQSGRDDSQNLIKNKGVFAWGSEIPAFKKEKRGKIF